MFVQSLYGWFSWCVFLHRKLAFDALFACEAKYTQCINYNLYCVTYDDQLDGER